MTMWAKPWGLAEGTLVAAGLLPVGLMLELSVGPVQWDAFAWPVNIVVLAMLAVAVVGMHVLRRRVYAFRFLASGAAAVSALAVAAGLTVVMGLVRQQPDGTWLTGMLSFWPFVLAYTYLAVVLAMVTARQLATLPAPRRSSLAVYSSLLSHIGLLMALACATLGSADMRRLQMWTTNNAEWANMLAGSGAFSQYERFALDEQGHRIELPLAVELKRFIIDRYDDGTPRRYASEVVIYSKATNHRYAATIDVNHPVAVDGWKIYQKDYRETQLGDDCQVSILELVSDPWLPWVYAGIYLMLAGAVLMLLCGGRGRRAVSQTSK